LLLPFVYTSGCESAVRELPTELELELMAAPRAIREPQRRRDDGLIRAVVVRALREREPRAQSQALRGREAEVEQQRVGRCVERGGVTQGKDRRVAVLDQARAHEAQVQRRLPALGNRYHACGRAR